MQQSEICCICIRTNLELISIMETDPNTIKWSCKLNQCVPEVVWGEENRICEQCIEQLEAACAFRDLCLQSYAIRRQLLERSVQAQDVVKTEEITIDEDDLPLKIETDQDLISEISVIQRTPCVEQEFSKVKIYIVREEEDMRNATNKGTENEVPNRSYLRDLLQTPQEFLKMKNYTIDKHYSQYMEVNKNTDEISSKSTPQDPLQVTNDAPDDDDDVQYVETKTGNISTSRLQNLLEMSQTQKSHISLHKDRPLYAPEKTSESRTKEEKTNESRTKEEKTNESRTKEEKTNKSQTKAEKTSEKHPKNEFQQTKAYNLLQDGIECMEESTGNSFLNKSLLRDLLLKPQEFQKAKNYASPSHKDNFQYVEVKAIPIENENSNTFYLPDPLQTHQQSLKIEDSAQKNARESNFGNRMKRLPDIPRTEHYQCKYCAVKFKYHKNLVKHNKDLHHLNRPWDCIYCTKSFKTHPELKQHEKSHLNQRKYECSVCCRSFNTPSILAKHKIIKHKSSKDWSYLCPHCDQKYPFKAYRDQHIRRNHTNAGNEYVCFHCSAGFSSKLLLIAHIRYKHNSDNPMKQCHVCQNTYINQTELDGHMLQKHNLETIKFPRKVKKYKCEKCCKLYTTLKAKNNHCVKCDGIRRHKKHADDKIEWLPS